MRSLGFDQYGNEQLVGTDPVTGAYKLVTKYADCATVTDRNAELRKDGHGDGKDMKLAASIPGPVIAKWMQEGFNPFDKNNRSELRRRLNSNEFNQFRVWEGRL